MLHNLSNSLEAQAHGNHVLDAANNTYITSVTGLINTMKDICDVRRITSVVLSFPDSRSSLFEVTQTWHSQQSDLHHLLQTDIRHFHAIPDSLQSSPDHDPHDLAPERLLKSRINFVFIT